MPRKKSAPEERPSKLSPELEKKLRRSRRPGGEKLTPEETRQVGANTHAWMVYFARHPEEQAKQTARAKARDERARLKRMAKHQPEATDVQSNGKFVHVEFTRNNGERVEGIYELIGWGFPPSNYFAPERNAAARAALRADEAREQRPLEPGKTP